MSPEYALLLYLVLPLWLLMGLADWASHRRHDLAHTSGSIESLLHLLMLAEAGVPIMLALLCEVNILILLIMGVGFLLHSVTAYCDTRYAASWREIGPFEQMVHGYLEVLPYTALMLLLVAHWPHLTTAGAGPDWTLRLRSLSLPPAYLVVFFTAVLLIAILPFMEELRRSLKARASP